MIKAAAKANVNQLHFLGREKWAAAQEFQGRSVTV